MHWNRNRARGCALVGNTWGRAGRRCPVGSDELPCNLDVPSRDRWRGRWVNVKRLWLVHSRSEGGLSALSCRGLVGSDELPFNTDSRDRWRVRHWRRNRASGCALGKTRGRRKNRARGCASGRCRVGRCRVGGRNRARGCALGGTWGLVKHRWLVHSRSEGTLSALSCRCLVGSDGLPCTTESRDRWRGMHWRKRAPVAGAEGKTPGRALGKTRGRRKNRARGCASGRGCARRCHWCWNRVCRVVEKRGLGLLGCGVTW